MVGKKKRQSGLSMLGNHQKCWLWGRHAVLETLRSGRWIPHEVCWDPEIVTREVQQEIRSRLKSQAIQGEMLEGSTLQRLCGAPDHQGLIARMPEFPYSDFQDCLQDRIQNSSSRQNVLVLCGIQDPFNFGSILRSADLFGISTIIIPSSGQSQVNSHVVRSSVGAVNYLNVVRVDSLESCCKTLQQAGFRLLAASEKGETLSHEAKLSHSVALLVGNEGNGVPARLLDLCDELIVIPQHGHVDSLNAAVAAGILCYEMQRQQLTNN